MRQQRHPLVGPDIDGIVDHMLDVTGGDMEAAGRRLDEIDDLIAAVAANPESGTRLSGPLSGWLVLHGGRDQKITVVFRADTERGLLRIALIAFGGQNWLAGAEGRQDIF